MAVRSPRLILSVVGLLTTVGFLAISCSKESPTSPAASASAPAGRATISGTLVNATAQGLAGDPLPGVTVRAAGARQSTQTDDGGRFTLSDLPPGQVALEFRGAGISSGVTFNAAAGTTTRVTVALNRGRGTVTVLPRSEGNGAEGIVDSIPTATSFVLRTAQGLVTIQTDANTLFRNEGSIATFADLKVGLRVEVEGARQADGSILAARVNFEEVEKPEATKTPTPTGTITPATPRPTRTPELEPTEIENEATKTPTPPRTPTATRTQKPEGED